MDVCGEEAKGAMAMIWGGMLALGTVVLLFTGGGEAVMASMLSGAQEAVTLSLELAGAYLLFMGLVGVARKAGLMESLSRALGGVTGYLFPRVQSAWAAIALTFSANMLGMGNAATPFGLAAMQEMQKLNRDPQAATDEMCTFLAVNSSALQLVPTTLIALRQAEGSLTPAAIVIPSLIASAAATAAAVVLCKLLSRP